MQPPTRPPKPSKARLCAEIIVKIIEYFYPPVPPYESSLNMSQSAMPFKAGRVDKFQISDFVPLVRNARPSLRALPVTAIESYDNAGVVPHRYSILTICNPHGGSTYVKLELRVIDLKSILTAELADDRSALICPDDRRHAALEFAPRNVYHVVQGPSLDAIAELLDIICQRTGERYDISGRNCLWLADLVLFGSAMKFKEAWLSAKGRIFPDSPMRSYLCGEIDVLATSTLCFLPEGAPTWMGTTYGALGRVFGAFNMQREVEDVVGMWQDYKVAFLY